ncbi:U-box domain-containing protein 44-like [Iris pallida]|uniref:RING-type E3 ubiquitin transferase n=1 Tax=Iris pallida TaxID=29817 RepID=A0AAX6G2F8_IRIPA|nr:U-box domain-containing protein 44-like [Iris pallida]
MAQSAGKSTPATALDSINRILPEIIAGGGASGDEEAYCWDPPRRFSGFAKRLQLLVHGLSRSADLSLPAVSTSLRGIAADLDLSRRPLSAYRSRSRIHVLINCIPLCSSLRDISVSLSSWLALLDSSLIPLPDLRKKAADLSADMQNPNIKVTENEERVYCTLQKEAEVRQTSKAVQSAIIMDLARALGMDSGDRGRLSEQIKLLRSDLVVSSTVEERRILMSLEKIFDSWSATPCVAEECTSSDFEEDAQIPPFKNFLCPLTKEVMKDPVVVESSQTYERTAIKCWFDRCLGDARDPTCPVTGQVLDNLELKPNIGLKGAIEEWVNRNVELQIKSALNCLGEVGSTPMGTVDTMLDNVYRISEEYPESRYKVRNAGVVGLVVRMLKDQSERMGSQLRCKALMAMFSMAKDEESKIIMVEEGMTRLAIRSLTASLEKEREYALRLLLEFSSEGGYCRKLAFEKGALVLLSSMTTNLEYPTLSNLAEEILKNMEMIDENVEHLAMAGRYQPLLTRLCKGTEDVKVQIAILIGKIPLTDDGKDYIARKGGRVLIDMLSSSLEGRESSLQALYNLSTLDDNATVLVDFGLLPALTNILFAMPDCSSDIKVLSASTIANILSNSGHWELAPADKDGHPMQSEFIIHRLLELLTLSSGKCQAAVIHILWGIAASPQASDLAATHIRSAGGIAAIVQYLDHMEPDLRTRALKLVNLLSEKMGQVLVEELRDSNKLPYLKEKLLDPQFDFGERAEIVCILARLPFSIDEVKTILGPVVLRWAVSKLKEQKPSSYGKNSASTRRMVEGLLGLLLHYARNPDTELLALVQEYHFMNIFCEHISNRSHERAKQKAAFGLKYLSESSRLPSLTANSDPQPPSGFCVPLVFICSKKSMAPVSCPLHSIACEEDSSFCLLRGNAIKPLVELLNDENTQVQIAAVEALSTVVSDSQSLKNAAEELEQFGLFDAVINLFKEVRPGELQERLITMVESFSRVETILQDYSTDQHLVRALVEALRHGNSNTKRHAQDALTNLRQISGVGGKSSNPSRVKKSNR